jgi:hypothetical protein
MPGQLAQPGYADNLVSEVARVMRYHDAYQLYKDDLVTVQSQA